MNLFDALPAESFVPFQVQRLASPKLLWSNVDALHGREPLDFAYCIPFDEERAGSYLQQDATAFGERYGGPGLGGNSGGVRCGLIGDVQVKGIGRNPLAGTTTDFWHKHGGSSVQDCVRESIWGEILNASLPYGAVRALAIISTGTTFDAEVADTKKKTKVPRALLLREPVLRPAHYLRSVFSAPSSEMKGHCTDVTRTMRTIQKIETLHHYLNQGGIDTNSSTTLGAMLSDTFRRAAHQIAASRAKRIIHGSLISSNFGMDGRWLDFGTVTTLSDFGRAIVSPGSLDLWNQQASVVDTINDLHFYLTKYLPLESKTDLPPVGELVDEFLNSLRDLLEFEFLKLTGIPPSILQLVPLSQRRTLWRFMMYAISKGNNMPYLYFGDDRHAMPARTGAFSLSAIMQKCALSTSRETLHALLKDELLGQAEADLVEGYWSLRELSIDLLGASDPGIAQLAVALRGLRANFAPQPLFRRELDGKIDELTKRPGEIAEFIERTVEYWAAVLGEKPCGEIRLNPWLTHEPAVISGVCEILINESPVDRTGALCLIDGLQISSEFKAMLSANLQN